MRWTRRRSRTAAFAAESEIQLDEIVGSRLRDDMMPFHFQIAWVYHHSGGALQGMRDGRFSPPSFDLDKDYQELQALVGEATAFDILRMLGAPLGKMDFSAN